MGLIKKLRKAKKEAPPNEKPAVVKTHLRDMIIVPEMIGSVVGIYNGKVRRVAGQVTVVWGGELIFAFGTDRSSTLLRSSLRWLATTSPSSRAHTSPSSTVVRVSVPPTPRDCTFSLAVVLVCIGAYSGLS